MLVPLIFLGGLFVTTFFAWVINTWDSQPRGNWAIRLFSMIAGFVVGTSVTGAIAYEALYLWSRQPGKLTDLKGLITSPVDVQAAASLWFCGLGSGSAVVLPACDSSESRQNRTCYRKYAPALATTGDCWMCPRGNRHSADASQRNMLFPSLYRASCWVFSGSHKNFRLRSPTQSFR